jgi:hypothetical protein
MLEKKYSDFDTEKIIKKQCENDFNVVRDIESIGILPKEGYLKEEDNYFKKIIKLNNEIINLNKKLAEANEGLKKLNNTQFGLEFVVYIEKQIQELKIKRINSDIQKMEEKIIEIKVDYETYQEEIAEGN